MPNHTSDQHEWFQEALAAGRGSAARDRYIFREGRGHDGSEPPTDWESLFGGSAWERVADGQWYLHIFAVEQPDLNWAHREVRDDFVRTLRFWSDRGVDGFRIDVAHMLTKDLTEPLPSQAELNDLPRDGQHPIVDRDDVHEVYAEWRAVFDSYDPPRTAVAEAWVDPARVPLYASAESLGQAFNFDLLEADFDADQFRRIVTDEPRARSVIGIVDARGCSPTTTSSGMPRATDCRIRRAAQTGGPRESTATSGCCRAAGSPHSTVQVDFGARGPPLSSCSGCPGSAYLYQGEELGLHEVVEIDDASAAGPDLLPQSRVGRGTGRMPRPAAVDAQRQLVRLRR